jgi:sarcosine oxidase subunit alpha
MQFSWKGSIMNAQPGDTIASALFRSGVRTFTHSYEYGRPRGIFCLTGACPNCMVNVDGVPNVRSCTAPVQDGLTVLAQNQNVYRGLESPTLKPFPPAPALVEGPQHYEHVYLQFDVVVVGGGPSGIEAARAAAVQGQQVALLEKQSDLPPLPGVANFANTTCFGLYEGNLVGAVQIDHSRPNAETLFHLRAGHVVLATGAYETQLLFANNDVPGIMLSTAVLRLIQRHGIIPGRKAVLVGETACCSSVEPQLITAGIEVLASVPVESVVRATGRDHVTGLVTDTVTYNADLVVMCGSLVPALCFPALRAIDPRHRLPVHGRHRPRCSRDH